MLTTLKKIVKLSLIALIIINLCLAGYVSKAMNCFSPTKKGKQTIIIEKGLNPKAIARILKDNQLLS